MSSSGWSNLLLKGVIQDYGQPRAVADHIQIQHLARMLAIIADRIPREYPLPPDDTSSQHEPISDDDGS